MYKNYYVLIFSQMSVWCITWNFAYTSTNICIFLHKDSGLYFFWSGPYEIANT